jgi:ribonuclease HII
MGVDEAGLGPNLGPLAIATSVWSCERGVEHKRLRERLEPNFQAKKLSRSGPQDFIPLGDSKQLYQSGMSTDSLAVAVVTLLRLAMKTGNPVMATAVPRIGTETGRLAETPRSRQGFSMDRCEDVMRFTGALASVSKEARSTLPWYGDREDGNLAEAITDTAWEKIAMDGLRQAEVGFYGMKARLIDEIQFNQQLDKQGGKGKLLSILSLELIREVLESLPFCAGDEVEVYCDRHGGRQRYHELLSEIFPKYFFWIDQETAQESIYSTKQDGVAIRIRFTVGGDSHPPTALASMLAKWLREITMERFNEFWRERVPEVKPTAGYPVDAKRFIEELANRGAEKLLSKELWWRKA